MKNWLIISVIPVILLMGYFVIENNFTLFVVTGIIFPVLIVINHVKENGVPSLPKKPNINVTKVIKTNADTIDSSLLRIPLLQKMNQYFMKEIIKDIPRAGIALSPLDFGLKNIKIVIITCAIFLIISIVVILLTGELLVLLLLIVPVMIFFYNSNLSLKNTISDRRKGVDQELLFFVVFCDIMDNTQSDIHKVFNYIINDYSNLFPAIKKEALYLNREVTIFGKSSLEALVSLAKNHPSTPFKDFIQGYLTSQSSGGRDTGDYLSDITRKLTVSMKQKMNNYVAQSDGISQVGGFMLVMYPMFIVVSSSMMNGQTLFMATILGLIIIPAIMTIMIKKIEHIQPFLNDSYPIRKEPIIISGIIFVVTIILGLEYWEMIAIPLIVWSFVNYFMSYKKIHVNHSIEKSIPQFIRDMNQNMLSQSSFFKSFKVIHSRKSYSSEFNGILNQINSQIILGEHLHNAMINVKIESWLGKLVISLLSFTSKSGVITANIMEKIAEFSNNYLESKQEIQDKTNTALMLGYMGSLIVVGMIVLIPSISLTEFTTSISNVNEIGLDDTLSSLNSTLLIVVAFFSMVLVSKIKYSTINQSLHIGILLTLVTVVLYYDKFVGVNL